MTITIKIVGKSLNDVEPIIIAVADTEHNIKKMYPDIVVNIEVKFK